MSQQSKLESFIEANINVASGFFISLLVWQFFVAPLYGFDVDMVQNLQITAIFTVSAVIRGYFWRRFFAKSIHKHLIKFFLRNRTA